MSDVVITGGLGFILSYVTEYLAKNGLTVAVIDNCSIGSHPEIVDGSFKLIQEDFSKQGAYELILSEDPKYVIHAAAITDVDYSIKYPEETLRNNISCNLNAYEAARKLKNLERFLYVNTDEVYGECEYEKQEDEILFPRNPYAISKATGSILRYGYDNTYPRLKSKTTEIRMCNIFGPRQDKRKIFPQIIKSIKDEYSIPLQNDGLGFREYLYVKNIPPLIELILEKGLRTYNITSNEGFTVLDIFRLVESKVNRRVKFHSSDRPVHDRWYRMDNSRIRDELGWNPKYSFSAGLDDYLRNEGLALPPSK